MTKKKRFDFTRKNKSTGKIENVGYLDLTENEEQSKASLYFYGDIVSASSEWKRKYYEDDKCPKDIADYLSELDGYEEIEVHFNSGGGEVFAGLAIYNQLKRHKGHKKAYVDGMAASIASVIMFACDEVYLATGSQVMIHKPSCWAYGNADDLRETIEQLDLCENSIVDVYIKNAKENITREQIKDLMAKETWFNGEELARYFNTKIEERAVAVACTSDFFSKYVNIPKEAKKTDAKDIVNTVIEEMENREKQRIEDEKAEILADLFMYGA